MTDYAISRVSSDEQANEGKSLAVQEAELLQYQPQYPDKKILKENIYRAEGKSGGFKKETRKITYDKEYNELIIKFSLKNRPDLTAIMKRIKPGDNLFVTKFDRLTRSAMFLEALHDYFKENSIEINPLHDSKEDIVRQIFGVLSGWERQKTTDRNDDIRKQKYIEGLYSNKPPIGYSKTEEDKLIFKEPEATMIKDIFQMTIEGKDYKEICSKYPKIHSAQYYKIIRNKTYCGYTSYENESKKVDSVPQIISESEWFKANEKN